MLTMMLLFITAFAFSQNKNTFYYGGITISNPAYFPGVSTSKAVGFGIELQREHFFSEKFSWIVSAGYNHFSGNYSYFNSLNSAKDTVIHNFDNIPLLTGVKFYFVRNIYVGAEAGLLIGINKNIGTVFSLAPSAGYKIQIGKKNDIDVGIRLINAMQFAAPPESNSLRKGGYGIWSLKIAYSF